MGGYPCTPGTPRERPSVRPSIGPARFRMDSKKVEDLFENTQDSVGKSQDSVRKIEEAGGGNEDAGRKIN